MTSLEKISRILNKTLLIIAGIDLASGAIAWRRTFGQTMRKDAWWIQPVVVFTVFTGFIIYSTWAAFQGTFYFHDNLLSPFYSPEIWGASEHALLQREGTPGWWPGWDCQATSRIPADPFPEERYWPHWEDLLYMYWLPIS